MCDARKVQRIRGQSLAECAVVLGFVLLAVAGMSGYIKRSAQAGIKAVTDDVLRIDEGDVSGELTQETGIGSLRPSGMEETDELSRYTTTVGPPAGPPAITRQTYRRGNITLESNVTTTRIGNETSRELTGPAQERRPNEPPSLGPPGRGGDGEFDLHGWRRHPQ